MFLFHDFNADLNNDGVDDAFIKDLDPNGDGHSDALIIDVNGDGNPELELFDTNGDGDFDSNNFHPINAMDAISDLLSGDFEEPSFTTVPDDNADPFDPDSYDVSDESNDLFDPDSYDAPDDNGQFSEPADTPSSQGFEFGEDLDGDGFRESVAVDINGDGIIDGIGTDTNMDGVLDKFLIDTDGDGEYDINTYDEPAEATDDTPVLPDESVSADLDGDGYEETEMYDTNGDGNYDLAFADIDKDGIIDSVLKDTDYDGVFDVAGFDYDGDGQLDEVTPIEYQDDDAAANPVDSNGRQIYRNDYTGIQIGSKEYIDSDGDGENDTYIHRYSSNGDSFFDTSEQFFDTDGDGEVDAVIKTVIVDTDGDGNSDTYAEYYDEDADGTFDVVKVYDYDSANGIGELVHLYDNIDIESGIFTNESDFYNAYDCPTFKPEGIDPDDVVGDPEVSMEHWEYQGDTGRCAIYSQKFIIEQYTGQDVDIDELVDKAISNGWFSEDSGTPMQFGNKLLDLYGIPNEVSYNNSFDDLREALDSGKMVIVDVDADEYWGQDTDDVFSPADGVNHEVQVIGIDESDPEHPMVILNDSGSPRGCGEMVPADVFMDSWDDGNNIMIVAG